MERSFSTAGAFKPPPRRYMILADAIKRGVVALDWLQIKGPCIKCDMLLSLVDPPDGVLIKICICHLDYGRLLVYPRHDSVLKHERP